MSAELKNYIQMLNLAKDVDVQNVLLQQATQLIKLNKFKFRIDKKLDKYELIDLSESTDAWLDRFITVNHKMLELKNDVKKLAPRDEVILIVGPTGTGKELIARALHGEREGKFVAVNCAGLPDNLIESLMFGHVKGAFTGADKTTKGLMSVAEGGTFFLDEIGELPLLMQGKFLRAIQEMRIRKIGSEDSEDVKCRIVCATNKNLYELEKAKLFRLDLLARITTFELFTIGLDQRPEDIETLLNYFDKTFVEAWNSSLPVLPIDRIDTKFNVRSLQQHIKRYQVFGRLPK